MDGFVLAPLAIVGYAGAVLVLGVIIRYSGGGKLPIQLEAVSSSSSSLPSPASSTTSSLKSTIVRGVKSATSTFKVAVRIPVQAVPRWTSLTELIAKRWRKRIMLEQLPITASQVDDDPILPAPATPQPVLVDLAETSNVLSPLIQLRVLGTATPAIRSPTPLPPIPNGLAASRSSLFTLESYSAPSTPPPYLGHKLQPRFELISPFSSPPPRASRAQQLGVYVPRPASPSLIYPGSRPRTPSPVYNNPHFLATSPVLGHYRRTRSFGGLSPKRVIRPPPPGLSRNGSGTFVAGSSSHTDIEMTPYLRRPLSSRSTELLIDLEDGMQDDDVLISFKDGFECDPSPPSSQPSSDAEQLPLLHSPVAIRPSRSEPNAVEFPSVSINNSWRQWEREDHDLLSADADYDIARFNTFEADQQSKDVFGDLFAGTSQKTSEESTIAISVSMPPTLIDEGDVKVDSPLFVEVSTSSPSEPIAPSQMPTPPASPPLSLLRMPSTSSYSASPVDDYLAAKEAAEDVGNEDVGTDLEGDWEDVSKEEGVTVKEPTVEGNDTVQESMPESPDDDPPLPELPRLSVIAGSDAVAAVSERQEEARNGAEHGSDHSFDDPPLPEIDQLDIPETTLDPITMAEAATAVPRSPDFPIQELVSAEHEEHQANELVEDPLPSGNSASTTPIEEKERPSWSVRASEAPRLGLAAGPDRATTINVRVNPIAQDASKDIPATPVAAPELIARSDSIPGAFPSIAEVEPGAQPAIATVSPEQEEKSTLVLSAPQQRPRTVSMIDTTSFAAAVVSLRRKPEPLDVALAMQMRPGVGAGADPAWMVRFMMAVFGWLAVTMSAGID